MNKFQFMGRLTKDVETKSTSTGTTVATFSIAVNRKFGKEKEVDFFNLTAFNKTAEFVSKYFKKGHQVLVEGRIQNRTWEDQTGTKRYATDFIVEDTYFADSKSEPQIVDALKVMGEGFVTVEDQSELPF